MLKFITEILNDSKSKSHDEFMRMVRYEYKSIKPEYVEHFLLKNDRLPTVEELQDAM